MKNFFVDIPPDTKIRFLPIENCGFPLIVSIEEAKRIKILATNKEAKHDVEKIDSTQSAES